MLCSLIWLFTYTGLPGLYTHTCTHMHTHRRWGNKTHTPPCGVLSLFLAQILVQVVVVAAVELVGFHVVFRYNFFSCFSFSYFPCAGTNICTWQELLLRKWLSVLKFLCYLLQTLSQSTNPSFRRGYKIATRWKAQILRRHMALNNLWPSKIETATWSPE